MAKDPASETPERGAPLSSEQERERAVLGVLRHQEERERAAQEAVRRTRRRGTFPAPRHLVLVLTLLAATYLWVAAPSWATPTPPTLPSADHVEASLRLALYAQSQRIVAFRAREARLPTDLEELGPPIPGIRYTATERGTYHLDGVSRGSVLFLSSSSREGPDEFLGAARLLVPDPEADPAPSSGGTDTEPETGGAGEDGRAGRGAGAR